MASPQEQAQLVAWFIKLISATHGGNGSSPHWSLEVEKSSSNDVGKSNTPSQFKYELDSLYGDSAPSFTTVKFWAAEFKRGRKSLGDDERLARPNTATTD
ncbi:HTH_48 domain-containing protein [Trichonephila clavipes]|nr:HTH_48 domain-containing protein [Trichonephila clavipes]